MYDKINITENHITVLSLFTNGFDREYYIREVGRLLEISPRTAQLILDDLEKRGVIGSVTKGRIKSYTLKKNALSRRYVMFVEQHKTMAFWEKNLLVREVIEKITPSIKGIGTLFGSYAKGMADRDSDLDIFVAGEYDKEEARKISKRYGIEISIKCYPMKLFERNFASDVLLKEVLRNHIIFLNSEQFVRTVLKDG